MLFFQAQIPTAMKVNLLKNIHLAGIVLGSSIQLWSASCTHEPADIGELDTVCFDSQVLPLLQTSCGMSGCHGSGYSQEGFDVSNYQTIMQAVSPGDPRGSELYKVITNINGENMMPPDLPLTKEQRTIIQVWIAQGAGETSCETGFIMKPVN